MLKAGIIRRLICAMHIAVFELKFVGYYQMIFVPTGGMLVGIARPARFGIHN